MSTHRRRLRIAVSLIAILSLARVATPQTTTNWPNVFNEQAAYPAKGLQRDEPVDHLSATKEATPQVIPQA